MFRLPTDLQDIICRFAYDATLSETKRSLAFIISVKVRDLHPVVVSEYVNNYTEVTCPFTYDRMRQESSFFAPWRVLNSTVTPFRHFFVWFARSELWNHYQICAVIDSMDFRSARKLMHDCPILLSRHAKATIIRWIHQEPTDASLYLSNIFRNLTLYDLRFHPGTLSRFIISDHASKHMNWTTPTPLHM